MVLCCFCFARLAEAEMLWGNSYFKNISSYHVAIVTGSGYLYFIGSCKI